MAGLLGFTLADLTGAVDSRKRQYGNLVRGLLSDPGATLAQLAAIDLEAAQRNRYTQASAWSVMPEVAQQGQQAMMDAALNVGGLLGITAYHGSPHKFDKFDMSKIGTGEGAQAYGHGLYFAEAPEVAKQYQDALKWRGADWNDAQVIAAQAAEKYGSREAASESLKWALSQNSRSPNPMQAKSNEITQRAISILDDGAAPLAGKPPSPGAFYKVDIPDEAVSKMLDWDKPLSQQPEAVRKALAAAGLKNADSNLMTGSGAYGMLSSKLRPEGTDNTVRDTAAAAKRLRELGIPGIRYLDAGSRGKGGTSNFVLFDDALPKILSRE